MNFERHFRPEVKFLFFAVVGCLIFGCQLQSQEKDFSAPEINEIEDLHFQNANRLMLEEDYAGAIELYEQVRGVYDSATINHNLGIAYFLDGNPGRAVLHFERALRQGLSSASTNELLSLLRNSEGISPPKYTLLQRMARAVPEGGWMILTVLTFWGALFFGIYVYGMVKKESIFRDVAIACVLIFLIGCLAIVGLDQDADHGVMTGEENGLKVVPTSENEVFLTLKGGEMARYLKSNNNYVFVETSSGVRGWLAAENFSWIRQTD